MTTRIGLAVGRESVRAVMMRRHRVVWTAELPYASLSELEATAGALLASAPPQRFRRPVIHVALGPHAAQTKRLVGLPEQADSDALAAVVREAIGTYFLKNGVPLLTTRVQPVAPGIAIAAAIDRPYIDALRAAGKVHGWRIGAVAPTAVALTHAIQESQFQWTDGPLTIEVSRSPAGTLDDVRTRPARGGPNNAAPSPVIPLAELGANALPFADAFGAAALDVREPLVIDPESSERARVWQRSTVIRLGLILLLGVVIAGLSPFGAQWAGTRARTRVSQVRPGRWQVVSTSLGQIDRVSAILRQAHRFVDSRTSLSTLLGELGRSLPDQTAVLEFDWRNTQGDIMVVTPNPSAVLAVVRRLPGVTVVELRGSVGRQVVAGQDLQRVTIHFATGARR